MRRFEGKVALITGGARGIGRGIALALAGDGADIVIVDRDPAAEGEETADEIKKLGRRSLLLQADVGERDAVESAFEAAVAQFETIDIAVANAACSVREEVIKARWEDVQRTIEVSQLGVFHVCQLAAQQMVKQGPRNGHGGKILITGSVHEEIPFVRSAAYNMAKAAINHFARTLAAELAPSRINVNVINPGWINTPGERKYATSAEIEAAGKKLPWGRVGTPADIGKAAAFLVSDDADYITGASLKVDGGFVLGLQMRAE